MREDTLKTPATSLKGYLTITLRWSYSDWWKWLRQQRWCYCRTDNQRIWPKKCSEQQSKQSPALQVYARCKYMPKNIRFNTSDRLSSGIGVLFDDLDDVKFVEVPTSFMIGDGSINAGYLHNDGVHLTGNGVNKLSQKLNLQVKNPTKCVFRDGSRAGHGTACIP